MAVAKKKTSTTAVTINRQWQLMFIVALVFAQLLSIATMIWSFVRISRYVSGGTWTFQVVSWVYPVLYIAAAYLFVRRRVKGAVPQLFWSMFIATMGMVVYYAMQQLLNFMFSWFNWWPVYGPNDRSIWDAFGITWLQMAGIYAVFVAALWLVAARKRG